jgi:hypothetical protein
MKRRLEDLESKYVDLVHLARADPDGEDINGHLEAILEKYPAEAQALADPANGDWQHGFNSGVLAAVRLIEVYRSSKSPKVIKQAEDDFPQLDT